MRFQDDDARLHEPDDDELVARLRALDWPALEPAAKDRCWREFERRFAGLGATSSAETGRVDFTRRRAPRLTSVVNARFVAVARLSLSARG